MMSKHSCVRYGLIVKIKLIPLFEAIKKVVKVPIYEEKKKCQNRHGLFLTAERACPDPSKFERFIPLEPLVFELGLFKPKIGISFFGLETRMARPIAPKICTRNDSYVPQLRCKFEVSVFSRFKLIAFLIFVYEFVKLTSLVCICPKPRDVAPPKLEGRKFMNLLSICPNIKFLALV